MAVITDFNQIVDLVKKQQIAYLQHPVLGPILRPRPPGGYFSLFENNTKKLVRPPALIVPFEDQGRALICRNLSIENGSRLLAHPGHVLSRQSGNKAKLTYAGAVKGVRFTGSYVGDPSHIDELRMIALLVRIGDMTKKRANEILTQLPNEYVRVYTVVEPFLID